MNILVIDDEKMVAMLVTDYLKNDGRVDEIFYLGDYTQTLEVIEKKNISIVLLDLFMPSLVGLDILKSIKEKFKNVFVIIVSSHFESHLIDKAISQGCNAYTNKNIEPSKFSNIIDVILSGKLYLSPDCKHSQHYFYEKTRIDTRAIKDSLSKREIEILNFISEGMNSEEIANRLFISKNTVEFHRKSLFKKFDTNKSTKMVKIASQNNII